MTANCQQSRILGQGLGNGDVCPIVRSDPIKDFIEIPHTPKLILVSGAGAVCFFSPTSVTGISHDRAAIFITAISNGAAHTIQLENQSHRDCFHSGQMNVGQLNIANLLYILIPHYIMSLPPIPLYGCFPNHQHKEHSL